MKYLFFLALLLPATLKSQQVREQVSRTLANQLRDSLDLSQLQYQKVYEINLDLEGQKAFVRQESKDSPSLRKLLQQVENRRDSLYFSLFSTSQSLHYKEKKSELIRIR